MVQYLAWVQVLNHFTDIYLYKCITSFNIVVLTVTGQYAFAPVAAGFFLGALFVYGADVLMTYAGVNSPYDLGK